MASQTHEEPGIVAAAERLMHAWSLAKDIEDHSVRNAADRSKHRPTRFITISRETGAGGSLIGQCVGERLGWKVFDRNLLDCVAERFRLPRMMLDLVDETRSNWVYDVLGTWMDRKVVPHEKYVACLGRVVLAAAHAGHAVFVGRGAQFILPRKELLAVRLVASLKYRVQQIMERMALNESDAQRYVNELDQGRREFGERFFHHDITDPHLYDMVINVERCGVPKTVSDILASVVRA